LHLLGGMEKLRVKKRNALKWSKPTDHDGREEGCSKQKRGSVKNKAVSWEPGRHYQRTKRLTEKKKLLERPPPP